ncbi:MAG: polysaccharide pyruvyl transferase family protein [Clostridia bacterium]|nr:polysaccharide pyruvyl transferase family protein [Clostridia bacterium]
MSRVFLYAYDKQNLGDDLFIHTICKRYPKTKFYLWSDKENKEKLRRIKNLSVVDERGAFVRTLKKIRPSLVARYKRSLQRKSKAVVYIGGSIFMEYADWQSSINWWGYLAQNFPMHCIGCNWGPYKTEGYLEGMSKVFEKMQDVSFRDSYSYDTFSKVRTVRIAPDILFSYPIPQSELQEKTLFVSLINCGKRGEGDHVQLNVFEEDYLSNLSALLTGYLQNGYAITLASFSKLEGDEEAISMLRQKMGIPDTDVRVKNVFYDGTNEEEVLSAISASESVIATRFHAAILAIAAEKPVLPIVYSDKTLHVLEDIGFSGKVLDLRKGDAITFEEAQENFRTMTLPNAKYLAQESQKHFEKLDKILK